MFSSDSAITTNKDDLLGRADFASELAKAIIKNTGTESIVVGLYGSWGCGKTSLVNMVLEAIDTLTNKNDDKPLIVVFSPWSFATDDNLISAYFKTLRLSLNIEKNNRWKQRIGKALDEYADTWDVLNYVPVAGPILAPTLKTVSKLGGKRLSATKPLDEAKRTIENRLLERNQKMIVVIDDIDRLEIPQIRAMFQLVKQIVSFPNTVYILPMDRAVVARALIDVQGDDGNTYLEKIVQIPYVIPEPNTTKLQRVFFEKADRILSTNNTYSIDKEYWGNVFSNCVWPFMRNIRDINRVLNMLEFKMNLFEGELCIEDLMGMTTIDVLEPSLYQWIGKRRNLLCMGNPSHYISRNERKLEAIREEYEKSLIAAGVNNVERAISAIASLFPQFSQEIEKHFNGSRFAIDAKKQMRISELKRADFYFEHDRIHVTISRSTIRASLEQFSQNEFESLLDQVNEEGNIYYYLDEVGALVNEIAITRIPMIIRSLWSRMTFFRGESRSLIITVSATLKAENIVDKLLLRMVNNEDRYNVIKSHLFEAGIDDLEVLGRIINSIELGYGRLAGNGEERKQNQIVDIEKLIDLEKGYVQRALILVDNGHFFTGQRLLYVSYLWESFNSESFITFINSIKYDNKLALKWIIRLAGKWYGANSEGWNFNKRDYSNHIPNERVYEIISTYDKSIILQDFNEDELIRIASFFLQHEKQNDNNETTVESALELVNTWKKSTSQQIGNREC